jgi:hypothetical protein
MKNVLIFFFLPQIHIKSSSPATRQYHPKHEVDEPGDMQVDFNTAAFLGQLTICS